MEGFALMGVNRNHIVDKRKQDYCTYCTREFGSQVSYNGKVYTLQRVKEHFTPICQGGLDGIDNIVVACQLCNGIKGDKNFDNGIECRNYILDELLKGSRTINGKIIELDKQIRIPTEDIRKKDKHRSRLKHGKFVGRKKLIKEELLKEKQCIFCQGKFKGRKNKVYCSDKCCRMAFEDRRGVNPIKDFKKKITLALNSLVDEIKKK